MSDWTDAENDQIVTIYFDMLMSDLKDEPYNKAENNRRLQALTGRSRGSIEFKLCNVSAACIGLAQPIIPGYKPRSNLQLSLAEAVSRWLAKNEDWEASLVKDQATRQKARGEMELSVPPGLQNAKPDADEGRAADLASHFDVAARDARRRALGRAGEECALAHERSLLRRAGRSDLADRVIWTSQEIGDGAGYDIQSYAVDGSPRLLEVKTTTGWDRTPFYLTRNEMRVAEERREHWTLFRVYDFTRQPRAFELRPPLDASVALTPMSFQASFEGSIS